VSELVRAAGGILLRGDGEGRTVALVHRPRYDDWSFPKGKLDGDEDEASAALREVEEETGLRCRLGRSVGAVTYLDRRGRPKVVRYFEMEADGEAFTAGSEVDEVRWVPVAEAEAALTYAHDRGLLRRVVAGTKLSAIYLVRHAKAGLRSAWSGPDEERPLTRRGRKQARRLVDRFQALDLERIVSSPYVRCVETVEPLAAARGLRIETATELAEGQEVDRLVGWMGALDERPIALCGHGTEIRALIQHLEGSGTSIEGERGIGKGSVWVLERKRGRFVSARYLPPPPG
jgi:8-oxo-dGTP diphosphatase